MYVMNVTFLYLSVTEIKHKKCNAAVGCVWDGYPREGLGESQTNGYTAREGLSSSPNVRLISELEKEMELCTWEQTAEQKCLWTVAALQHPL